MFVRFLDKLLKLACAAVRRLELGAARQKLKAGRISRQEYDKLVWRSR